MSPSPDNHRSAPRATGVLDSQANECYFFTLLRFAGNSIARIQPESGGLAQLGERLNGIQEVEGSIPLSSTHLKS